MKKFKVISVVGTRPEIIRLSRVLNRLDQEECIDHILIHTGQNYDYELNEVFFQQLKLKKPDYFLNAAGKNAIETIGQILININPILLEEKPDAFLVLGDTNSCLCAIPAKRLKIPIFHMEAGNRCFDLRVPEEINRRIVDHISDINLTYSSIAREYLLREGLSPEKVIKTGSPMKEVINAHLNEILNSDVLEKLSLKKYDYFLVSAHREENIESDVNFNSLIESLNAIADEFGKRIIVSTHPRTRNRIDRSNAVLHEKIELMKPLGFLDYVNLQLNAATVLSDSGTITEESSILNFPALNIREAHERPEGMEEAAVIMTGLDKNRILQGLSITMHQKRGKERELHIVADYDVDNVSDKVLRIILSYTDYVNRTVWRK